VGRPDGCEGNSELASKEATERPSKFRGLLADKGLRQRAAEKSLDIPVLRCSLIRRFIGLSNCKIINPQFLWEEVNSHVLLAIPFLNFPCQKA
jgi:hypothetical protein